MVYLCLSRTLFLLLALISDPLESSVPFISVSPFSYSFSNIRSSAVVLDTDSTVANTSSSKPVLPVDVCGNGCGSTNGVGHCSNPVFTKLNLTTYTCYPWKVEQINTTYSAFQWTKLSSGKDSGKWLIALFNSTNCTKEFLSATSLSPCADHTCCNSVWTLNGTALWGWLVDPSSMPKPGMPPSEKKELEIGLGVAGGLILLGVLAAIIYFCYRRRNAYQQVQ
jgi:hypothetical protein